MGKPPFLGHQCSAQPCWYRCIHMLKFVYLQSGQTFHVILHAHVAQNHRTFPSFRYWVCTELSALPRAAKVDGANNFIWSLKDQDIIGGPMFIHHNIDELYAEGPCCHFVLVWLSVIAQFAAKSFASGEPRSTRRTWEDQCTLSKWQDIVLSIASPLGAVTLPMQSIHASEGFYGGLDCKTHRSPQQCHYDHYEYCKPSTLFIIKYHPGSSIILNQYQSF